MSTGRHKRRLTVQNLLAQLRPLVSLPYFSQHAPQCLCTATEHNCQPLVRIRDCNFCLFLGAAVMLCSRLWRGFF